MNMNQYNGKYACAHCEHEGVPRTVHLHRDWPYQENLQSRTHFSMIDLAKKAVKEQTVVRKYKILILHSFCFLPGERHKRIINFYSA